MKYHLLPLTALFIVLFSLQKMNSFENSATSNQTARATVENIQHREAMMDLVVSLGCPAEPAKDTMISVTETDIFVDNASSTVVNMAFPTDAFDLVPVSPTDTLCLIFECEIATTGSAFADFEIVIDQSPISSMVGQTVNFSSNSSTQSAGALLAKTISVDEVDPGGAWQFSFSNFGSNFGAFEGIFTTKILLKRSIPAIPSDCDLTICDETKVTLDAENPGSTYLWNTGEMTQTIEVTENGNYAVTVSNGGETGTDDINVSFNSIRVDNPQTICQGQPYIIGSSSYTTAGTYEDELVRANGCDSLVKTILTVTAPVVSNLTETICDGASFTVGSSTYTTAGTYEDTLIKVTDGCDSIVNLTLSILQPITFNQSVAICPSGSVTVGTSTYTMGGTFTDILTSFTGCDSTVTTLVAVESARTEEVTVNICEGQNHMVGDSIYTTSGIKTNAFMTSDGCDSILTTNLFVNPKYDIISNVGICEGQSIVVGSNTYNVTGQYVDNLMTASGCDSIITTNLTVNTIIETDNTLSICKGTSITVGTSVYSETGSYMDSFTSTSGCDSIVTTNLTVEESINTTAVIDICYGGFFLGNTYFESQDIVEEFPRADDCDSIHTTTINVAPELKINVAAFGANCVSSGLQAVAEGGSGVYTYLWSDGSTSSERPDLADGIYTVTVSDPLGCSVSGSGEIGVFFGIDVEYDITNVLCNGETSGAIDLMISGTPPYTIEWSNGAIVEDLVGIPSGFYTVFVEDAIGCVFGTSIEVQEPAALFVEVQTEPSTSGNNGSALAVVSGGIPPYTFIWTTGESSPIIEDLRVGSYRVVVKDSNGCEFVAEAAVNTTTANYELNELSGVTTYPNPSYGNLSMELEFETSKEVQFDLFNLSGQMLQRSEILQGRSILWQTDLSAFPTGTYFVAIRSEGKMHVEKVILIQ